MPQFVDVVSVLAVITGFIQLLGPAPDTRTILREHSTGVMPIVPLAAMFTSGWIWAVYGLLNSDIFPLMVTNAMGVLVATFYISVYYWYTRDRAYAHKVLAGFGLAVVAVTLYAALGYYGYTNQSRTAVKDVMGYIGNVVVFVLFVAPFENVAQVFRHRSGAFIPIMIVLANILNGTTWLTYSLLVSDWLIFVPNVGSLIIGSVQAGVYLYFHPHKHPLPVETTVGAMRSPSGEPLHAGADPAGQHKVYAAIRSSHEAVVSPV